MFWRPQYLPFAKKKRVPEWLLVLSSFVITVSFFARILDMRIPFFYAMDGDWGVFGIQTWDMLHGHFRVFMYRQAYMGIFPLFMDAFWFLVIGPGRFAQGIASLCFWILYLCALYFVTKKIFSSRVTGLLAVVCGTLLPDTAMNITPEPSRGYMDNFFVGLCVFWITLRIIEQKDERVRLWALLGIVGGLSFWTSFFAGYFLLPAFVVLLLAKPKRFFQPHAWTALLCFFIGSLPFWYFNLTSYPFFATFNMFDSTSPLAGQRNHLEMLVYKFHYICGAYSHDLFPIIVLGHLVIGCTIFSFFLLLISLKRKPLNRFFSSVRNAGILLVVMGAGTVVFLNLASDRYGGTDCVRYLFPLFPFIHIAVARLMMLLFNRNRVVFVIFFFYYVFFYLYDIYVHDPRLFEAQLDLKYASYRSMLDEMKPFLDEHGRPIVTTPRKWDAVTLSFDLIEEGMKFVEPVSLTRARDSLDMDAQPRQYLLEPKRRAEAMEKYLSALGFGFSRKDFGSPELTYHEYWHPVPYWYTLFYDIKRTVHEYAPVRDDGILLRTSSNQERSGLMTDGTVNTCWVDTGGRNDEKWIEIDCGRKTKVDRVLMVLSPDVRDGEKLHRNKFRISAAVEVEVSDDARNWSRVFSSNIMRGVFHVGDRIIERRDLGFVPLSLEFASPEGGARYYRIKCSDASPAFKFRVGELLFFERLSGSSAPDISAFKEWIVRNGVKQVYAAEHISAAIMNVLPTVKCFNEYPWEERGHPLRFERGRYIDLSKRTGVVVEEAFAYGLEKMFETDGVAFSSDRIGSYRIFALEPTALNTSYYWLSFYAVRVLDIEKSFAALKEAGSFKKDKTRERSCLIYALNLYPYNIAAYDTLKNIAPETAVIYKETAGVLRPEISVGAVFGGLAGIDGYTLKGRDINVYARFLKDSDFCVRIGLFALSRKDGRVLFSTELAADTKLPGTVGIWSEDKVFEGQCVSYACSLPDFDEPVELWLVVLDKNGKRMAVSKNQTAVSRSNRIKLTSLN